MFDKMKQLMDMKKRMEQIKLQLDNAVFDILSDDNSVKISMTGSQEVRNVTLNLDLAGADKPALEKSLRDAYNKAIKHSHEIAAQKMKDVTGFNLPGLI